MRGKREVTPPPSLVVLERSAVTFADLVGAFSRCRQGWRQVGARGRLEGLASPSWNVYIFAGDSVVESMQSRKTFSRVDYLSTFVLKGTILLIKTKIFGALRAP